MLMELLMSAQFAAARAVVPQSTSTMATLPASVSAPGFARSPVAPGATQTAGGAGCGVAAFLADRRRHGLSATADAVDPMLVSHLAFASRAEYVAWRTVWRAEYATLTTLIRAAKRRTAEDATPLPVWHGLATRHNLSTAARHLLLLRAGSKRQAGAAWRAERAARLGVTEAGGVAPTSDGAV
jgi:hypothetical protein